MNIRSIVVLPMLLIATIQGCAQISATPTKDTLQQKLMGTWQCHFEDKLDEKTHVTAHYTKVISEFDIQENGTYTLSEMDEHSVQHTGVIRASSTDKYQIHAEKNQYVLTDQKFDSEIVSASSMYMNDFTVFFYGFITGQKKREIAENKPRVREILKIDSHNLVIHEPSNPERFNETCTR